MTKSVRANVDLTDFTKIIESESDTGTDHGVCTVVQVRKEANWLTPSVRRLAAIYR
jgi:hypothetical protein